MRLSMHFEVDWRRFISGKPKTTKWTQKEKI